MISPEEYVEFRLGLRGSYYEEIFTLEDRCQELTAKVQELYNALLTYGSHLPNCTHNQHLRICTCGWDQIKKRKINEKH